MSIVGSPRGEGVRNDGLLELNFSRNVPVTTTPRPKLGPVSVQTALGSYHASETLRPLDLLVLAHIGKQWEEAGRPNSETPITFSISDVVRSTHESHPDGEGGITSIGGENRKAIRESFRRLFNVQLTADLEVQVDGQRTVRKRRDVRVLQEITIATELASGEEEMARLRGTLASTKNTLTVYLSRWLVEQLESGLAIPIDMRVWRQLRGVSQRLYALLPLTGEEGEQEIPVTDALFATLGVNASARKEKLRTLREAARKIENVSDGVALSVVRRAKDDYAIRILQKPKMEAIAA